MTDSDDEFEKFLQESLSSTLASGSLISRAKGEGDATHQKSRDSSDQDLEALGNVWLKSSRELNARSVAPLPDLKESIREKDTFSSDSLEAASNKSLDTTSRSGFSARRPLLSKEQYDDSFTPSSNSDTTSTPAVETVSTQSITQGKDRNSKDDVDDYDEYYEDDFEPESLSTESSSSKTCTPDLDVAVQPQSSETDSGSSPQMPKIFQACNLSPISKSADSETMDVSEKSKSPQTSRDSVSTVDNKDKVFRSSSVAQGEGSVTPHQSEEDQLESHVVSPAPTSAENSRSSEESGNDAFKENEKGGGELGLSESNTNNTAGLAGTGRMPEKEVASLSFVPPVAELVEADKELLAVSQGPEPASSPVVEVSSPTTQQLKPASQTSKFASQTPEMSSLSSVAQVSTNHIKTSGNTATRESTAISDRVRSSQVVVTVPEPLLVGAWECDTDGKALLTNGYETELAELQSALTAAGLPLITRSMRASGGQSPPTIFLPNQAPQQVRTPVVHSEKDTAADVPSLHYYGSSGSGNDGKVDVRDLIRAIATEELTNASKDILQETLLSPSKISTKWSPPRDDRQTAPAPGGAGSRDRVSDHSPKQKKPSLKQQRQAAVVPPHPASLPRPAHHKFSTTMTVPKRHPAPRPGKNTQHSTKKPAHSTPFGTRTTLAKPSMDHGRDWKLSRSQVMESRDTDDTVVLHKRTEDKFTSRNALQEKEFQRRLELELRIKEEEMQSQYSQEITELNHRLAAPSLQVKKLNANVQALKAENESLRKEVKEQEDLIQSYHKENERLYGELTSLQREARTSSSRMQLECQRMANELTNARAKLEECTVLRSSHLDGTRDRTSTGDCHSPSKQQPLLSNREDKAALQKQLKELQASLNDVQEELVNVRHKNKSLEVLLEGSVSKQALEQITRRHQDELAQFSKKSSQTAKAARQLEEAAKLLKSREAEVSSQREEIMALKEEVAVLEATKMRMASQRAATTAGGGAKSTRRIQELEKQVREMERVIQKKFPNSLAALVMAASSPDQEDLARSKARVEDLEHEVKHCQQEMEEQEKRSSRKCEVLQQELVTLKRKCNENDALLRGVGMQQEFSSDSGAGSRVLPRIGLQPSPRARSLSPRSHQVLQQEGGSAIPPVSGPLGPAGRGSGRPVGAEATKLSQLSDIVLENTQLKQKLSELNFELAHQRIQWQGKLAETERRMAVDEEEAQKKLAAAEVAGQKKLDSLLAKVAKEQSHSDVIALQSRLKAREATITHLKEVIKCLEQEGRRVSDHKAREAELEQRVMVLSERLVEAEQHHTPEMHQFVQLKSRIRTLEERCSELSHKYRWGGRSSTHTTADVLELEHKWKCRMVAKNTELEKYREEVDSLLAALRTLQQGRSVASIHST